MTPTVGDFRTFAVFFFGLLTDLFCCLYRFYVGHFVLCYKEEFRVEPLIGAMANFN